MFLWLYLTLKSDGTMEQSFPMGVCEALILVMQKGRKDIWVSLFTVFSSSNVMSTEIYALVPAVSEKNK